MELTPKGEQNQLDTQSRQFSDFFIIFIFISRLVYKQISPSRGCRPYLYIVQYLPNWSIALIHVESCILRTGTSSNILDAGKQQKSAEHHKDPIKGKSQDFSLLLNNVLTINQNKI